MLATDVMSMPPVQNATQLTPGMRRSDSSNTFTTLSTTAQPRPLISTLPGTSVPLSATPMASARLTGLVSQNATIVPTALPISVSQTVNTASETNLPLIPPSPRLQSPQLPNPPSPRLSQRTSPRVSLPLAGTGLASLPSPGMASLPSGRSVGMESLPSIRTVAGTAEVMGQQFEISNYQGVISRASIENELLNAGYGILSKIIVRNGEGADRTRYIKAVNKKGQKVFIMLDGEGYTTARTNDLTLIESHMASVVPYSVKTGAYNCAGKDVCGVAFECGSDSVCVLYREPNDLKPKEANLVFVQRDAPAAVTMEIDGNTMSYPVIRLSEIRANPDLVLSNTDLVTRRLRNEAYTAQLQELAAEQMAIEKLGAAFMKFNTVREDVAMKLNRTLTQLEQYNDIYMARPPMTDEAKDKYRRLQFNLVQRNDGITLLIRLMERVAAKKCN